MFFDPFFIVSMIVFIFKVRTLSVIRGVYIDRLDAFFFYSLASMIKTLCKMIFPRKTTKLEIKKIDKLLFF